MPTEHLNDQGEPLHLTGKARHLPIPSTGLVTGWVQRTHPDYRTWLEDELRWRASFVATWRALRAFLEPYYSEQGNRERVPRRARFGYGIGLNRALVRSVAGHVRRAPVTRSWGPLGAPGDVETSGDPTKGTVAALMWEDATGDGTTTWTNFWDGKVLEWMLTSPGILIVVDLPPGQHATLGDALKAGQRPTVRAVPMSWVLDLGHDERGALRWVKLHDERDLRQPKAQDALPGMPGGDPGLQKGVLLYELGEDGIATATRYNLRGEQVGTPAVLPSLQTPHGQATLPLFIVRFGEHEEVEWLGSGILSSLADIVIDLYNLVSEMREAYREEVWAPLAYRGENADKVRELLGKNSRFLDLGSGPDNEIARVAASATGVTTGIEQVRLALTAWALEAQWRNADAVEANVQAKSGVAIEHEFEVDRKPLLVSIAETLDAAEEQAMYLAAQLMGNRPEASFKVSVERGAEFRLEEEAGRISRIVGDFIKALDLPDVVKERIVLAWLEHAGIPGLDLDAPVEEDEELAGGERTLRSLVVEQLREAGAAAEDELAGRAAAFDARVAGGQPPQPPPSPPPPRA